MRAVAVVMDRNNVSSWRYIILNFIGEGGLREGSSERVRVELNVELARACRMSRVSYLGRAEGWETFAQSLHIFGLLR